MKFTLNNFYSNNYKDFIHLEALKNVLRKVPRLKLAGVENIDNVLSMEFSVDDWGENPMYIKYIDTDNKEHIVKIRPAVTEQIYEILKAYAKISYVDEQDKKLKDELHTEIMQGDENTLNLSKTYTDTVVNHAKDEINHTIETTKQELKDYCDNKCAITLASSKDYTDTKAHELNQRIDEEANRITTVSQLVTANDAKTTQALADVNASVDSINDRFDNLSVGGTNLMRNTTRDYVKFTGDGWAISFLTPNNRPIDTPVIGGETYTFSAQVKNDSSSAGKIDLEIYQYNANNGNTPNGSSSEINAWVSPGEEKRLVFTKKLLADTTKVRLHARNRDNNGTVTYWTKMAKVEKGNIPTDWSPAPEDEIERVSQLNENIASNSNRITTVSQLVTANDNKTTQALANVNDRIDNLPRSSEVTLGGTTFKERLNIETDNPNDFYSTVTLEQRDGSEPEVVGRLVKGDVAKKADLDLLSGKVTDLSTTKDNRLSEIPKTGKATYVNWYPNGNINYIRLLDDGEYTRAHINKPDGLEQVVYLPKSKIGDKPTGTPTDIKFNTGEDVTEINFLPGNPDRVVVSTARGLRMNASFITQTEKTNIANLVSWKTNVTDELTRMNGSVVDIPKEQFTPLNGLTIDRNTAFGKIFKFNNFAIIRLNVFVANITMPSWTFKDAVSFPKSYLSGFSKFTSLNEKRQITDDGWPYDNSFDIDKCMLGFYTRGNEYNNKGLELSIAGILYN